MATKNKILHPDWKNILLKSRTVKISIISTAVSSFQVSLPYLEGFIEPRSMLYLAAITGVLSIGTVIARIMYNPATINPLNPNQIIQ
jgi:hypothetical protein